MKNVELTWSRVAELAHEAAVRLNTDYHQTTVTFYGIPRGGIFASLLVQQAFQQLTGKRTYQVSEPVYANVIVDDLYDTGRTQAQYAAFAAAKHVVLVDKRVLHTNQWVTFPWEVGNEKAGPTDAVVRLLEFIGEDPHREGLRETPTRVIKSYNELFAGYQKDVAELMTTFEDGSCDEMVILRNIEFQSFCEHHMLPFVGIAHVAYVPNGRVIGVSKLARIVDVFARRLQIQERICQQVTSALDEHLCPLGAACVIEAKHLCMTCRGVGKQNSVMTTSSLTGVFRDNSLTRQEFFSMIK